MGGRAALVMTVGLVLSYLVLGVFTALIYRTALGGLILGGGALVLLGVGLAVAWAAANRRGRATGPGRRSSSADAGRGIRPRRW